MSVYKASNGGTASEVACAFSLQIDRSWTTKIQGPVDLLCRLCL